VEHEVGVGHLGEGRPERLHELVGQATDEADRVAAQDRLAPEAQRVVVPGQETGPPPAPARR
jgi:hypothetical protein